MRGANWARTSRRPNMVRKRLSMSSVSSGVRFGGNTGMAQLLSPLPSPRDTGHLVYVFCTCSGRAVRVTVKVATIGSRGTDLCSHRGCRLQGSKVIHELLSYGVISTQKYRTQAMAYSACSVQLCRGEWRSGSGRGDARGICCLPSAALAALKHWLSSAERCKCATTALVNRLREVCMT